MFRLNECITGCHSQRTVHAQVLVGLEGRLFYRPCKNLEWKGLFMMLWGEHARVRGMTLFVGRDQHLFLTYQQIYQSLSCTWNQIV